MLSSPQDTLQNAVQPPLRCSDVRRSFDTPEARLEILKGVTLTLHPAQIVAILGPSGSGKSTLLHLLGGLDRPTSGEVYWGERAVHDLDQRVLASLRARALGLIFQQHYLLEDLSVLENVTPAGAHRRHGGRGAGARLAPPGGAFGAHELLAQKAFRRRAAACGGGAGALQPPRRHPSDEPTGSLDRQSAKAVYELLVELAREEGSAVLMVTHDEGLVEQVDARYHLDEGVLVPEAGA